MAKFSLTIKMTDPSQVHEVAAILEAYLGITENKHAFDPDGFCGFLTWLLREGISSLDGFYVRGIVDSGHATELIAVFRQAADTIEQRLKEYERER